MSTVDKKIEKIRNALFTSKQREEDLIKIFKESTREERIKERKYYDEKYSDNNLIEDVKKKLSGDFKDLTRELFLTRAEYDAEQLYKGLRGINLDYSVVYEIIFNRPSFLIESIKELYLDLTERNLEDDIERKFSGSIKKSLIFALNNERSTNENPDSDYCQELAQKLQKIKPNNWIDNEDIMESIFLKCSAEELVLVSRFYLKNTGNNMKHVIDNMSKQERNFFLGLFYNVVNPSELYAIKVNRAIKGLGTDNSLLERCIVNRYDMDMPEMKKHYQRIYNVPLIQDVINDTTGTYKELMCYLVDYQGK